MNTWAPVLSKLKENPIEHAWTIQDLMRWPDNCEFHFRESAKGLSYVLKSGHPATREGCAYILSDEGGELSSLLSHVSEKSFVIRESRASLWPQLQSHFPDAKVYFEQRMDVDRNSFRPFVGAAVRRLETTDAEALAAFFGAPPQAARGFHGWIQGGILLAAFVDEKIASIGSVMVRTPDAWVLVSIETRPEFRGRGFAKAVTSALTDIALQEAAHVSLTVVKDNLAAIKVYSSLGYVAREDRIWVDNGLGAAP